VNRTLIRGVIAALMSMVVMTGAGVVGTALAEGADVSAPRTYVDSRGLAPHTPLRWGPLARVRPVRPHASRAARRSALVGSPRTLAHVLLLRRGWSEGQWGCLDALWTRESGWRLTATNRRSGAYGIPQSLPASKMAAMGSDWRTDALTQIRWGLWYIGTSYGNPCRALAHSNAYGYY
jgi:hypothetical protein